MNKTHEKITNRIIEELEKGNIPWKKPWKGSSEYPKNLISGKTYSGINFFMLSMSHYESNYFLTFNQAKAISGNVKKGEKGFPVIFYGQAKGKENSKGETEKGYSFLKSYTVFNIEQCENLDHSRIEEAKTFEPLEFNPIEEAENIIKGYIGKPEITFKENQAFYRPLTDSINMPKKENFNNVSGYYSTLFHEMTHSTGHKKRLARPEIIENNYFGSNDYSKEELTAELGSAFLCSQSGIDNTLENSVSYLQSWLKVLKSKDNSKWIIEASSKAQKAVNYINGDLKKN
jgi:antirestriction protein ArdC